MMYAHKTVSAHADVVHAIALIGRTERRDARCADNLNGHMRILETGDAKDDLEVARRKQPRDVGVVHDQLA
jgi:hypothetical protein